MRIMGNTYEIAVAVRNLGLSIDRPKEIRKLKKMKPTETFLEPCTELFGLEWKLLRVCHRS